LLNNDNKTRGFFTLRTAISRHKIAQNRKTRTVNLKKS